MGKKYKKVIFIFIGLLRFSETLFFSSVFKTEYGEGAKTNSFRRFIRLNVPRFVSPLSICLPRLTLLIHLFNLFLAGISPRRFTFCGDETLRNGVSLRAD